MKKRNQPQRKARILSDAERYARIIAQVKAATGRTLTIEDVQRVQRGDVTPSHPIDTGPGISGEKSAILDATKGAE